MGAVKFHRKTSLPGVLSEGETHFVSTGGGTSYVQYVINNAGQAIPPATLAHSHVISDITGLQTALDSKATASGTAGTVAQFTAAGVLGNSPLTVSGSDVTAAAKIRATTSYVLPAVGSANTAYLSGNFDAFIPVGQHAAGVRPGYGFYAAGVLGAYLYAESSAELRLRTNTGSDYTLWHSGNSRSDAQNDARFALASALSGYVPTSRTLTINGTTFDLSANRSWTISAGGIPGSLSDRHIPKYDLASASFVNSSIEETTSSVDIKKSTTTHKNGSFYYLQAGGSLNTFGLSFYNTAGTNAFSFVRYNDEFSFSSATGNTIYEIGSNNLFNFVNPTGLQPFKVNSVTRVDLLNVQYLNGKEDINFTPADRTITINGVTQNLGANRSWTISAGGVSGTANYYGRFASGGTSIGDGFIYDNNTNRVFINATLQVNPAAWPKFLLSGDATNTYIHFADATPTSLGWINGQATRMSFAAGGTEVFRINYSTLDTTFQKAITIGGSAAVLNITSTTMVPNFNADMVDGIHGSSLVQTGRTITINGVTQDLSANRSWTISGGGSSSLAGLSDVVISSPQPFESLVYISGMWRNYSLGGISGSGTNSYIPLWNGSGSQTNSVITQTNSPALITIGNSGSIYHLNLWGDLIVRSVSSSFLSGYTPMLDGAIVFQNDGSRGFYGYYSGSWHFLG